MANVANNLTRPQITITREDSAEQNKVRSGGKKLPLVNVKTLRLNQDSALQTYDMPTKSKTLDKK